MVVLLTVFSLINDGHFHWMERQGLFEYTCTQPPPRFEKEEEGLVRSTSSVYSSTHRASMLRTGVRTGVQAVHPPLRFCCVTMATCEGWNEPLGLFLLSSHPRPLSEQKSWLRAIETEIGLGPEGEK